MRQRSSCLMFLTTNQPINSHCYYKLLNLFWALSIIPWKAMQMTGSNPSSNLCAVQYSSSEPIIMQSQENQIPPTLRKQVIISSCSNYSNHVTFRPAKGIACNIQLPDFPQHLKMSKPLLIKDCKEVLPFPAITTYDTCCC